MQQYPYTQDQSRTKLTVYCDNGGTITQATKFSASSNTNPNHTIADDYDVNNEIACIVANLMQFSTIFVHVKGHQNCTKMKQPLTLAAQLNIECDERAERFISYA